MVMPVHFKIFLKRFMLVGLVDVSRKLSGEKINHSVILPIIIFRIYDPFAKVFYSIAFFVFFACHFFTGHEKIQSL